MSTIRKRQLSFHVVIYLVHDHNAHDIPYYQLKRLSGRSAKVISVHGTHNVRVSVDETQKFVQQPKETFHARKNGPGERVVVLFQLGLRPFEHSAQEVAYGDDQ